MKAVIILDVYYNFDGVFRDDEITEIAGERIVGSGCGFGVRDVELHFKTSEQRETAQSELQSAGFRFTPL